MATSATSISNAFERAKAGGMDLLLAPRPGAGLVAATILIRRGSADEFEGEHGRAAFALSMLMRGMRRLSSRDFAFEMESLGAMAGESEGHDACTLTVRAAAPEIEAAMRLLFEALREPAFDPREHEIHRAELLAHHRLVEDDKFGLAYRAYARAAFAGHGYGRPAEGEERDAGGIAPEDCRDWHLRNNRPENALMAVAGDFEPMRWTRLIEELTADWPAGPVVRERISAGPSASAKQEVELTRPQLNQGFVVAGFRSPVLNHPDYPALRLASAALGEGFAGRVFTRLRDERGLAYACGAMLRPARLGSQQVLYIGTKPESVDEARQGLLDEAAGIAGEALSETDLHRAREFVIGKFLMGLQTHGQRAGSLAAWEDLAGDAALAEGYIERLRKVAAPQVREAAARWWTAPTVAVLRPG